jgi:two-component system CheB/CheR fusion protein
VNQALDIVQFRGATRKFIQPASGQPTWSLMRMLREGLTPDVRILIHSALKGGSPVRKDGVQVRADGILRTVDIEASPIASSHCLVIFMERSSVGTGEGKAAKAGKARSPLNLENAALRDELAVTQNSLQTIIEDQNASNEEMQSSNEEVLSANEELQSTNEELETAKEELQSTNEELTSLNDELSSRNRELDHLSNDLINVLSNANVSIVMIGPDLKIRRFTSMAEKLLKLIPSDVGRSLTDINLGFRLDNLEQSVAQVIGDMSTVEFEAQERNGQWYSIRIRPYKTIDNRIDGAVIVFINIDEAKQRERVMSQAQAYAEGIIATVRDPLIVLDEKLNVERVNQAFYDTFDLTPSTTLGKPFYKIGGGQWESPELRSLLEDVLPKQKEVRNFTVFKKVPKLGDCDLRLDARALEWKGQLKLMMLITVRDLPMSGKGK